MNNPVFLKDNYLLSARLTQGLYALRKPPFYAFLLLPGRQGDGQELSCVPALCGMFHLLSLSKYGTLRAR